MEEDGSFLDRFCQALRKCGNVEIVGRVAPRNALNVLRADWIILNWWEDEYFKRSKVKCWVAKWLIKQSRAKTAVVFHNKQPHECTVEKKEYYKRILKKTDKVILLTESSRGNLAAIIGEEKANEKGVVVHHPNYDVTPKKWGVEPDERFRVLFFGFLRPYKNIELLIEIAKRHPEIDFTIGGEPCSLSYAESLEKRVEGLSNVKLITHRLDASEIDNLIDVAHILCLPYNINSSQNSGVAMYAFSKGINVVIPEIETIRDLENKDSVYSYSYEVMPEHFKMLENAIIAARDEYFNNYVKFVERTDLLHEEIMSDYSVDSISRQISQIIERV